MVVYTKEYLQKLTNNENDEEEYFIQQGLPDLVRDGDLESVKNILEYYGLDFTEVSDIDYVGDGESADPGDFVRSNLLEVACESGQHKILVYFINQLIQRGEDPYEYVSDPYCVDQYMVWLNKQKLLLMRQKLPNNIVLGKLSKYLQPEDFTIFNKNNIRRLVTEVRNTRKRNNNNNKSNVNNKKNSTSKSKSKKNSNNKNKNNKKNTNN